ncbi:MAG: hypothetical protein ACRDIL_09660 [Candidatus Limnocylindrales bacterium]
MKPIGSTARRTFAGLGLVALVGVIALPVLAADPSGSPATSGAPRASTAPKPDKPDRSGPPGKSDKAAKPDKAARVPKVDVTVTGTVGTRTNAKGEIEYTLTSGSTTVTLDAGPAWFHKDAHPLKSFVGKRVTIVGGQRTGETEVDVRSVDGTVIRASGKPPWAGGWKRVGKDHPGWTQEKWDRWQAKMADQAKRHGVECWPPGLCKKPAASVTPAS